LKREVVTKRGEPARADESSIDFVPRDVRHGDDLQGGKVFGDWPGLADEQLYEGRDLNLTTDFRDVLGELVARHLGNPNLKTVFPGYENPEVA
jgi:hypothetical protein